MKLDCKLAGRCSGCSWISLDIQNQRQKKVETLLELGQVLSIPDKIEVVPVATEALRDRLDFTLSAQGAAMSFGLYDIERQKILDIEKCPLMSPELDSWYRKFRTYLPNLELGSVRLRVSPSGQRGAWLDFPNIEIKRLLDEKEWLEWLLGNAIVEMGQRRKRLKQEPERLRLLDVELFPWFETYIEKDGCLEAIPLYCAIGSFTQSGRLANRVLVQEVIQRAKGLGVSHWADICCGSGNFTFPLASVAETVFAVDMDQIAISGLEKSVTESKFESKIQVLRGNIYKPPVDLLEKLKGVEGILVDPPRSGLRNLSHIISDDISPEHILYVSCFAQSLVADAKVFLDKGYKCLEIIGVDQFPHSPHCEWIASFSR